MTKKLFAVVLLSLTLAACEPASNDNNSNANSARPNTNSQNTPAPVAPAPEPSSSLKPQVKAGDKVKVTINGAATAATVTSVDEKSGKVTVKIQGQKEEKTFAIADVVKD